MGTWGSGPFETDDAGDWMLELANGETSVRATLERLLEASASEVEAPLASEGVAAMALVAMGLDSELHRLWSASAHVSDEVLSRLIQDSAGLEKIAGKCVPAVHASELTELWGGDEEWAETLDRLAKALGADLDSSSIPEKHLKKPEVESGWMRVRDLGLPQYKDGWYLPNEEGHIVRVPVGTRGSEIARLAEVVARDVFEPEEDFDYDVDKSGHLVRRRFDPGVRGYFQANYDPRATGLGNTSDIVAAFAASARERLEYLRARVAAGDDVEALALEERQRDMRPPFTASVLICTIAEWRGWRGEGPLHHRAELLRRLDERMAGPLP